ncbi:MAG: FHA domain-containing protein [Planctomycetes bacterium]|jgi:pSer/pThr/pTyr-binding forkhead associated (FHA) protein|nr:FHA domain-containing protein [Planctomycetota bacterium]MBT4028966.1 FHA domain-containing protein [Planctomycetota bacterium]MBT4560385.1 FHA domain-containing protein [Planctomycetota bacterium]MBT5101714.1 FHA domain-containing protein [Planctomycetota bacterium]MBT5119455.1 FHA domain-containing protein [Planctomycetota bacterium]
MTADFPKDDSPLARTIVNRVRDLKPGLLADERFDAASMIQVEVLGGPMDGKTHFSTNGVLVVGRSLECDFSLDEDPLISGEHVRLSRSKGLLWLQDLSSTNGTFLGDEPVLSMVPVAPGVQFSIGVTLLEILA